MFPNAFATVSPSEIQIKHDHRDESGNAKTSNCDLLFRVHEITSLSRSAETQSTERSASSSPRPVILVRRVVDMVSAQNVNLDPAAAADKISSDRPSHSTTGRSLGDRRIKKKLGHGRDESLAGIEHDPARRRALESINSSRELFDRVVILNRELSGITYSSNQVGKILSV